MKITSDLHTHSQYSDGRGTVEENVLAAIDKGLETVAITDHGPANIGTGVKDNQTYLKIMEEVSMLNDKYDKIKIMTGAEADILDLNGTIDLTKDIIKQLDLLIVGLHPYVWPSTASSLVSSLQFIIGNQIARLKRSYLEKARINNTKALKEAILNYPVQIISHPGLNLPLDLDEISLAAVKSETALEVNTGHHYDKEELIRSALKNGVKLVVNSDAHFPETIGEFAQDLALLEKFQVPVEQVLNAADEGGGDNKDAGD